LEQQAKERLTGGVILVVLLVLLVPELLTGPRPAPPSVPAQPDQAPMRSYTMELGTAAHTSNAPVATSTAAPTASAPATLDSAPRAIVQTAPPKPLADDTPPPTAVAPPATPAAPRPRATAPPAAPLHNTGTWTVQLGTFSSRDNAARLVAGLKSRGFPASLSEVTKNGHKLFRVRVGAEKDKAAAQKLQGRLKAAGEKGTQILPR
jgi:cell division septation protein DedD